MPTKSKKSPLPPGQVVLISLCCVIIVGALLLSLPIAHHTPIRFIDALFTATSATCVTGLFSVPLSQFTPFGHAIILFLIQIGGLGFVTMTLMFLAPFVDFGLSTQLMAGKILDLESWQNIKRVLIFITLFTLLLELLGTFALLPTFAMQLPLPTAFFYALFRSISSFCNAGISLPNEHLLITATNPISLIVTALLSLAGGIGFMTCLDLLEGTYQWARGRRFRISLATKIILYGSSLLLIITTILFFLLEYNHAFATHSSPIALLLSLFQAIMSRSPGFILMPPINFHLATLFIMMLTSFVGASPASTGSGIKITTAALLFATTRAALEGKTHVQLKGRRIAKDQVLKSTAIMLLSILIIFIATLGLLITEKTTPFFNLFFEAWNAYTNLGLSVGTTPTTSTLSIAGLCIIMASMIMGRVGSFSLVLGLRMFKQDVNDYTYPEERVML